MAGDCLPGDWIVTGRPEHVMTRLRIVPFRACLTFRGTKGALFGESLCNVPVSSCITFCLLNF